MVETRRSLLPRVYKSFLWRRQNSEPRDLQEDQRWTGVQLPQQSMWRRPTWSQVMVNVWVVITFSLSSMTWHNRYCHDVSHIGEPNQCELFPTNRDVDGSPMTCCSPANRSSCSTPDFIQSTSGGLTGRPDNCGRGKYWNPFTKKCSMLYRGWNICKHLTFNKKICTYIKTLYLCIFNHKQISFFARI